MQDPQTREIISQYAGHLVTQVLTGHAVASPLGVWLLMALVAPAAQGRTRQELETVLGCPADVAFARAGELLGDPHPAVAAAAAVWDRKLGPAFEEWERTLPAVVERGPVPSKADTDAWARERTQGMIEEFPVEIDELTRLLLASALATDISWVRPLDVADGLLTFSDGIQLVAETRAAGLVAVAAPPSSSALDVFSVIAAPDVPPDQVDAAAQQVAGMLAGDEGKARRVPVEDLIDGHAWTVSERRQQRSGADVQEEWQTYLPAWSAKSDHDLTGSPGMAEVFETLSGFARPEDQPVTFQARQAAVASYTRTGFKAAAVTAVAMRAAGMPRFHEVLVRRVELRFNRPYAVLARAALDEGPEAWRGVPVFSAWVDPQDW
jgi:hypothetical protein